TIALQAFLGTPATVIPAGTVLSVAGDTDSKFATDNEVTLIAGTDEIQDVDFSAVPTSGVFKLVFEGETTAAINWDDSNTDVQTALNNLTALSGVVVTGNFTAGFTITFSGDDGKKPQSALTFTDNTLDSGGAVTITIVETTPGVYQGSTTMTATVTGPVVANAETLTVIDNPIAGLTSTINPEDATVGRNVESDADFRIRRETRLQVSLAGPLEAIRNRILELNDIEGSIQLEDVSAFENVTLIVDARGIPGKAFEVYIFQAGGVTTRDQEIIDAIGQSKPAGIEAHGDVSGTYTDSQGQNHTIKFSRPVEIDIYLELDLTVNADYPTDGDTQVKAAMVAWGDSLGAGQDVIVFGSNSLISQLNAIPGIDDVVVKVKDGAGPTTDDNIVIDDGITPGVQVERSAWDTGRIDITQI
ncbi:hypothetical protein KAR91_24655, partial [Candidatus Pacearchaeota archaeon]|nr:hypothetical protein [Candidatus Pacearchaeota archaeon]